MASGGIRLWGEPQPWQGASASELNALVDQQLSKLGIDIVRRADRDYMRAGAGPGTADPKKLSSRTGVAGLRGSLASYLRSSSKSVVVGSHMRYAAVHEFGEPKEIRPVRARWLTIPARAALTAAGVEKEAAKHQRELGRMGSPNDLERGTDAEGRPVLKHKRTGEIWFYLAKKVRTKARPYLQPAAKDAIPGFERRMVELMMPWRASVARSQP